MEKQRLGSTIPIDTLLVLSRPRDEKRLEFTAVAQTIQKDVPASYVRQAGFDPLQQEQMVRSFVLEHGRIKRRDVVDLCRVSVHQAKRLLGKLVDDGALVRTGVGRATQYERGPSL